MHGLLFEVSEKATGLLVYKKWLRIQQAVFGMIKIALKNKAKESYVNDSFFFTFPVFVLIVIFVSFKTVVCDVTDHTLFSSKGVYLENMRFSASTRLLAKIKLKKKKIQKLFSYYMTMI